MSLMKRYSAREWLSSLPTVLLLLCLLIAGVGTYTHAQLLKLGAWVWGEDYSLLRSDLVKPACHSTINIEKKLDQLAAQAKNQPADDLDLLGDDTSFDRAATRISLEKQQTLCRQEHQKYESALHKLTPAVKVFRAVEAAVAGFSLFIVEQRQIILLMLLWICAITGSFARHHISFREVRSRLDFYVSNGAEAIAHAVLLLAAWRYRESAYAAGIAVADPLIHILLILGFAGLLLSNVYQLLKPSPSLTENNVWRHAVMTIPLYAYMSFIAGLYFLLREQGYIAGVAILFSQLLEQASTFLNVSLYIWAGMLLKDMRLGELVFKVFAPWKLPPELLALVAIIIMAVPTAYTGASGIVVVATGALIYQELRRVGARRQLALAVTAMTGSSGVVLYPCLLAVLIAALNKEVVTDQLYSWGLKIFLLNALVFFAVVFITKKEKWKMASFKEAFVPCLKALMDLLPYAVIFLIIAGLYQFVLNTKIDEFSAPLILPFIVIAWLAFEKIKEPAVVSGVEASEQDRAQHKLSFWQTLVKSTDDSTIQIGALILLMGLSFVVGGVIGRSEVFNLFPLASELWLNLTYFLIALTIVGMVMDPYGAIVLVTGALAPLAYKQGIHPVHFWMMTLVAFEFGYLMPPVALNRLLTRQAVGEQEVEKAFIEQQSDYPRGKWYQHEYWFLPLVVMGTTLLIVTYLPLFLGVDRLR